MPLVQSARAFGFLLCWAGLSWVFAVADDAIAESAALERHRNQDTEAHGVPPVINCSAGTIRGKYIQVSGGAKVVAYLGVPFAEPPVGPLRFQPPVAPPRWQGVLNATTFGPLCVQSKSRSHWDIVTTLDDKRVLKRLGLFDYPQGEDCLNLNIYVPSQREPDEETEGESKGYSVMFFVHGGSYKTNGGRFYPGEWLSHYGQVIVITLNYRLGVLGFLSTQDEAAKGNYGLLDQVLALKWVKQNIEAFGGNPEDVTLFGNSAGGACVGLHLMSPLSRGLFSKVIAQSGSPIGDWAVQKRPRMYVVQLAQKLQCPDVQDSFQMVECLRNISAEEIIENSEDAKTLEDSLMLQFAPVVDKHFLPRYPTDLLRQEGTMADVPVMVGLTRDELEVWMTKSYQDKDPSSIPFTKDLLRKYLLHLIRKEAMPAVTLDVLLHAVYSEYVFRYGLPSPHHLKRKYLQLQNNATAIYHDHVISALPDIRTLGKIISDIDLKAPSVLLVHMLSMRSMMPVYFYEFDYASPDDVIVTKFGNSSNTWVGSYHESELYYVFGFPHLKLFNALRLPEDKEVSDMMVKLWTNFAKKGNPTPEGVEKTGILKNFTWERYTDDDEYFAALGLHPFLARSYEKERMVFWNHFVPIITDYPILWSLTKKTTSNAFSKIINECHLQIILTVSFLGWVTCILCVSIVMCRTCMSTKLRSFPIPI